MGGGVRHTSTSVSLGRASTITSASINPVSRLRRGHRSSSRAAPYPARIPSVSPGQDAEPRRDTKVPERRQVGAQPQERAAVEPEGPVHRHHEPQRVSSPPNGGCRTTQHRATNNVAAQTYGRRQLGRRIHRSAGHTFPRRRTPRPAGRPEGTSRVAGANPVASDATRRAQFASADRPHICFATPSNNTATGQQNPRAPARDGT